MSTRPYDTTDYRVARRFVLDRDNHTCAYCGQHANTVDHVMPVVNGGGNEPSNLVACCIRCNSQRGAKTRTMNDHARRTYRRKR